MQNEIKPCQILDSIYYGRPKGLRGFTKLIGRKSVMEEVLVQ